MAKAGIIITVDSFLTDTRIHLCENQDCEMNASMLKSSYAGMYCQLKVIDISLNGKCRFYEDARIKAIS
jgi:hypothetical protein